MSIINRDTRTSRYGRRALLVSAPLAFAGVTMGTGTTDDDPYISLAQQGVPNGVAGLDASGRLTLNELPSSVVTNNNTSPLTLNVPGGSALTLQTGAAVGNALVVNNFANGVGITMQIDWSANLTGTNTWDSVDIVHRSNGDGVYVVHAGGVPQALLNTGSGAANNGITYYQATTLSGAQGNAVTVAHVAGGLNTALSVSVAGSSVTVHLATDGAGNPVSTAAQVIAAVNATAVASPVTALALTSAAGTSSGAGTVGRLSPTSLSGGYLGAPPGADAALNAYVPFWLDDVGSGSGTIVNDRHGQIGLAVSVLARAGDAVSVNVNHRGGGPAFNIANQLPGPNPGGGGVCFQIVDYAAAATFAIAKLAVPQAGPVWGPAVISITSGVGATPFAVLQAQLQDASEGLFLSNDGTANFGGAYHPDRGRVWIDKLQPGGAAVNLVLSNPSPATASGCSLVFMANHLEHARLYSSYDTATQNGQLNVTMLKAGVTTTPMILQPSVVTIRGALSVQNYPIGAGLAVYVPASAAGYFALTVQGQDYGPNFTTSLDGGQSLTVAKNGAGSGSAMILQNRGTGLTLDVQVGAGLSSSFQILASGQVKFALAGNEATGSGSAALGANCPASATSAPYTWEKVTTADGSQGYMPVWK